MASNDMQWPYPGLGHAPSYQVSAIPFVTGGLTISSGSVTQISFPYVTSWIYLVHHDNQILRAGFSANGVNDSKYFILPNVNTNVISNTPLLNVKCTSLFLRGDSANVTGVCVFAGLTSIPASELDGVGPNGANWSGSSGVG